MTTNHRPMHGRLQMACAAILLLSALSAFAEGIPENFLRNGDFENGPADWVWKDGKGNAGGVIVTDPENPQNHILAGENGASFLASAGPYFSKLGLEKYAGKKLKLTFMLKGDPDAYPFIFLYIVENGKKRELNFIWKSNYIDLNMVMPSKFKKVERIIALPPKTSAVESLVVMNATGGGRIYFDNLVLTFHEDQMQNVPNVNWGDNNFNDEELLHLANTCNYLMVEWGLIYERLGYLKRLSYYGGGRDDDKVKNLEQTVLELRSQLKSLLEYYIQQFGRKFGKTFTLEAPHNFYLTNNYQGRELLLKTGKTRSTKEPFTKFEAQFAKTKGAADALIGEIRSRLARDMNFTPVNLRKLPRERRFDDKCRPLRLIWGGRQTLYTFFANQWYDVDSNGALHPYPKYDDTEKMISVDTPDDVKRWRVKGYVVLAYPPYIWWLPPKLLEKCLQNQELLAQTELGPRVPGKRGKEYIGAVLDNYNDEINKELERRYEELARFIAGNDCYTTFEYSSEYTFYTTTGSVPYVLGYGRAAERKFRKALENKFGKIGKLNKAWLSNYASFEEIKLPTQKMMSEMKSGDLPLIYEYRKLRKNTQTELYKMIYAAIKRGAPGLPVMCDSARAYINGNNLDCNEALALAEFTLDIIGEHDCAEGATSHWAHQNYFNSIARYLGDKPRGDSEYYPGMPESLHFNWKTQDTQILFLRNIHNLWKDIAWGNKVIFNWQKSTHPTPGDTSYENRTGYTLMDDYNSAYPYIMDQFVNGVEDILINTEIVPSAVGMLAPYDAPLSCYPDGNIMTEGVNIHKTLADAYYDYDCIPEELIVDGREPLNRFKVIFTPYTLWASGKLQEKLLAWVNKGGVLVAIAPFGFWDEYGRTNRTLINACFGDLPINNEKKELYYFSISRADLAGRENVKLESTQNDKVVFVSARHGQGLVYMSPVTSILNLPWACKKIVFDAINCRIGAKTAWAVNGQLEFVTRENRKTEERYLFVNNKSIEEPAEDKVYVKGEYQGPLTDLCIPGTAPVKAASDGGLTAFNIRLGPAEGTCIKLGKYVESDVDAGKLAKIMAGGADQQKKIAELLSGISTAGGDMAFTKAMICRKLALELMNNNDLNNAVVYARKALDYSKAKDEPPAPEYQSSYCATPPKIDGDEADWNDIAWSEFEGDKFKSKWDEDALYFLVALQDAQPVNDNRVPNVWSADGIEIYLDVLGLGSHREHDYLDYQYAFAPSGLGQVRNLRFAGKDSATALKTSQCAAKASAGGYVIETAVAHQETMLVPCAGYELAFNIRHVDIDETKTKPMRDLALKKTGVKFFNDTFGWPKLALTGAGPKTLKPRAVYNAGDNRILVEGLGNTLASIQAQVKNEAALKVSGDTAFLGAGLDIAEGAALVLGEITLKKAKASDTIKLSAGKHSLIELTGNCRAINLDAEALKNCAWQSYGKQSFAALKNITIKVTDSKGNPVRDVPLIIEVRGKTSGALVVEAGNVLLDNNGQAQIAVPIWRAEVEGNTAGIVSESLSLTIIDKDINASYAVDNVDASKQDAINVKFDVHRGIK